MCEAVGRGVDVGKPSRGVGLEMVWRGVVGCCGGGGGELGPFRGCVLTRLLTKLFHNII